MRGKGDVKLVQDKGTKMVTLVKHMEKTFKLCMNAVVHHDVDMKPNSGSDRSWVWTTTDYADFDDPGNPVVVTFAIKFKDSEIAEDFKSHYDKYKECNRTADVPTEEPKAEEPKKEPAATPAATSDEPSVAAEEPAKTE